MKIWNGIFEPDSLHHWEFETSGFNSPFHLRRFGEETTEAWRNLSSFHPIESNFKQRSVYLAKFCKEEIGNNLDSDLEILDFGGGMVVGFF